MTFMVRVFRLPRSCPPTPEEVAQKQLTEVARLAHLEPDIVKAARNQSSYRREYKARARRDEVENELRKLLHGKRIPAMLLNSHDGKLVDIDHTLWLAKKFTVDLASGQASWVALEKGQQIAYQGFVLIDRQKFDRGVREPKQSMNKAKVLCIEWARGLPPEPVWRKPDFTKKAMDDFDGLSQKSARKVWAEEVPDKWKKGGRKPRAS